jgi:hypothetical protein
MDSHGVHDKVKSSINGYRRVARSLAALGILWLTAGSAELIAQRGGRGGPPPAPREAAAIDLTGYWVSVITEDWKLRMVTPRKGAFDALPLNAEGRRLGNLWDPAKDAAAGEQCKAYGAGGLMRLPGRLHITWQDASTLRIDADAGTQTRILRFGTAPTPGEPSWQGQSVAEWVYAPARRGGGEPRTGSLKVVTMNLRPGYVRKNGVPYSKDAVVTEYYDVNALPNGETWFTVTTRIDDPAYFARPYITTTDFKKLPDAAGWNPTPCSST